MRIARIFGTLTMIFFIGLNTGFAQDKMLTMQDAIAGYHLYPRGLSGIDWIDDDHFFHYSDDSKSVLIYTVEETANGNVETLALDQVNTDYQKQYGDSNVLRSMRSLQSWIDEYSFKIIIKNNLYTYHRGDHKFNLLMKDFLQENGDYHKSNKLAFTHDNNLFINNGSEEIQITDDGGNGIVNGQAVHRFEFGITKGTFWSNDGSKLAFYRMDESMVTEYPLYVLSDTPATAKFVRYPVAGAASHHATVGVYDINSKRTVFLKTGEPKEQYLTNVTWSPDGKTIYIAIVNRGQNHMWLNAYDATSGDFIKTLFEETHDKYVEPEHGPVFLKSDPSRFVWWSERDGYNHLYLYNTDGKMMRQLTKGEWIVTEYHGWNSENDEIYITATKDSPIERHLYCVKASSGKMKNLTKVSGTHYVNFNRSLSYYLDQYSSTVVPRNTTLSSYEGRILGNLDECEDPLSDYKLGAMEIGSLNAEDGTELYYRVFKPIDFDPNKKYPVVVYLYNGPHLQLINNTWMGGANLWYQFMAQQGFIVFSIDGRGSDNRGLAFENAIFRHCGTQELKDQLEGVKWLASQGWADTSRMGIHGWSYGGFMTTSMMTRYPGVFKVGVAGGPVIDWKFYEIMYTERYMDTPEENPGGYDTANLINYVDKLEGKLLMIHGGQDETVLWQHSLLYLNAAIENSIQMDYFVYPDHAHNVRGKDRIHLYQKVTDYLIENLR